MRGLTIKTSRFYFRDKVKSTWPSGINKVRDFEKQAEEFKNVINVLVCIEKGDKKEYLKQLSDRILLLNSQFYKMKHAILLPFGHLSHNLESPAKAKEMINDLGKLLKKQRLKIDIISFGTHKDIVFEIPGQVGEVSYFEFPYSGKKPVVPKA